LPPIRVIDAQLHEPSVSLEWADADLDTRRALFGELTLASIDAVGVDGALLFPALDDGWAEQMTAERPSRFAWVPMVNAIAGEPDIEERLEVANARPTGPVGWRILIGMPESGEEARRCEAGGFDRVFETCQRNRIPVFLYATNYLSLVSDVATRYPDLLLVVDHLGLPQPPLHVRDDPPFASLPKLLALAQLPNVAVKFSGAPTYSDKPFPYEDLWPHLLRIVEAFGPDRLMWGSDISRVAGRIGFYRHPKVPDFYPQRHTYAEALHFVLDTDELSRGEKELILGGTARQLLRLP
jgi:L-fuconolactonase